MRMSPLTLLGDVGNLLHRSGYSLLTVDVEEIVINYSTPFTLMHELRLMGESNASVCYCLVVHCHVIACNCIVIVVYSHVIVLYCIVWVPFVGLRT